MAKKVETHFVDDIDGSVAEGTVRFGLDGADYEIDLNVEHAGELRSALEKYIKAGRKAGVRRRSGRTARRASGADTAEVREWAKAQGIDIKDRGRIPADVISKFRERAEA